MNATQLAEAARKHLRSLLDKSGEVLYSGAASLKPGPIYFLGLNPGGDPEDPLLSSLTIAKSLADLPTKTENSYLDTIWSDVHCCNVALLGCLPHSTSTSGALPHRT